MNKQLGYLTSSSCLLLTEMTCKPSQILMWQGSSETQRRLLFLRIRDLNTSHVKGVSLDRLPWELGLGQRVPFRPGSHRCPHPHPLSDFSSLEASVESHANPHLCRDCPACDPLFISNSDSNLLPRIFCGLPCPSVASYKKIIIITLQHIIYPSWKAENTQLSFLSPLTRSIR